MRRHEANGNFGSRHRDAVVLENQSLNTTPSPKPTRRRRLQKSHPNSIARGTFGRVSTRNALVLLGTIAALFLISVHVMLFRSLRFTQISHNAHDGPAAGPSALSPRLGSSLSDQESLHFGPLALDLSPLRPIDREKYTIRLNTWRRNEQLILSVNHHASCEGAAQIQIVWCDSENEPPEEVVSHPSGKIVIERHEVNSLNERFNILLETPTLGIFSVDDDVMRTCDAIDSGFFKWTQYPHRMVGYDTRLHIETEPHWQYGFLSQSEKTNAYSISLTRYAFLHKDYLRLYTERLPRPIFDFVSKNFNCEDIAMSFFVSSLTEGEPPLLADYWAVKSLVKLYSESMISNASEHKVQRDECVDSFAEQLGLKHGKGRIKVRRAVHFSGSSGMFDFGAEPEVHVQLKPEEMVPRHQALIAKLEAWEGVPDVEISKKVISKVQKMAKDANKQGLLEKSKNWRKRWVID